MGTDAALLAAKVVENSYIVLAIECITLAQAVDFTQETNKFSRSIQAEYQSIRSVFPAVIEDRAFSPEIASVIDVLKKRK